jgi:hypothetical protein
MPAAKPDAAAPQAPPAPEPAAGAKPRSRVWLALTNLSISRAITDPKGEKMADIIHKGETVTLTDEQAHGFLHRHRVPVIRPAADQNDPAPAIRARDLFGERPRAEAFGARPDPAGASAVHVNEDVPDPADPRNAPEATDPQTDFSVDPDAAKDK